MKTSTHRTPHHLIAAALFLVSTASGLFAGTPGAGDPPDIHREGPVIHVTIPPDWAKPA